MVLAAVAVLALSGCSTIVAGTPTWPGASLEKVLLTEPDFPAGVRYDRITEDPGSPDGAGGPPAMLSKPEGCSNAFTDVIAGSAERGPGSAAKYSVAYDGARMLMTVLSWHLDLDQLASTAARCESFKTFFDPLSPGIPIVTTKLPSNDGELVYQQTMTIGKQTNSIFMSFANVGAMGVFGIALPTQNPTIPVKGSLPQTFLDAMRKQTDRIRSS
ncbi:hypothetical protein BH09ACT8_BH09ACT8_47310 [soil metagenome]